MRRWALHNPNEQLLMTTTSLRTLVAASLAMTATAPVFADASDYVPRGEYEQLKNQFESLRERLDAMDSAAQPPQAATPVATSKPANVALNLDVSNFKPGWERFRSDDWSWMDHSRYDEMNAKIASGPGFELFTGMTSAGRFQALQQKNVMVGTSTTSPARLEPGFQTAWGSFEFLADFDGQLEVYFDVYLSTKAHANQLQGHEGYMLMRSLPEPLDEVPGLKQLMAIANVKAGQFDIDFGDHRYRRTDNARGQRNAFIGNTLIDPSATEVGVEIFSKPSKINWLVGVGSGSETGTFEDGRNMGMHGKLWVNFENLRIAGSAYSLDHNTRSTSFSNLYRSSRSGGQYNGVFDNGNGPGNIFVGAGKSLTAYQVDATWYQPNYELYSHVGYVSEDVITGEESWQYATFDAIYRFTNRLYVDARYNVAYADKLRGLESDGRVERIQIGGGYWLFKSILFKLEYVNERMSGFREAEGNVSGVQAWRKPSFQGVIAEFTFSY
jgi:hypothetical protein